MFCRSAIPGGGQGSAVIVAGDGFTATTILAPAAPGELCCCSNSVAAMVGRTARHGGAALIIDYGHDIARRKFAGFCATPSPIRLPIRALPTLPPMSASAHWAGMAHENAQRHRQLSCQATG
jgi:hypothetical protein